MRRPVIGRNRSKHIGKEKQALLANSSPPPSPSVWGVDDDIGLYPSSSPSSFENGPTATTPVRSPSPSSSALPERYRFHPQHEPRKGQSAEDMIGTAALQFVPAYEEATSHLIKVSVPKRTTSSNSPTKRQKPKEQPLLVPQVENSSAPELPTWDAIIEADDGSLRSKSSKGSWRSRKKSKRGSSLDSLSSSEEKKSSPSAFRSGRRRGGSTVGTRGPPKVISSGSAVGLNTDEASEVSTASRRAPRIARLASMFANRTAAKMDQPKKVGSATTRAAAMQQKKEEMGTSRVPSSPARSQVSSSSSAGFVAWPGTQDKRGKVTAMESSYDDSSVGAAGFRDPTPPNSTVQMKATNRDPHPDESDALDSDGDTKSAADFHLAAVLNDAKIAAQSNWRATQQILRNTGSATASGAGLGRLTSHSNPRPASQSGAHSVAGTSASTTLSIHNLFADDAPSRTPTQVFGRDDPWDVDSSSQPPSSPGTSISKDSSAFFHMGNGVANGISSSFLTSDPSYGVRTNVIGAASIIRRKLSEPQPPTERALEVQNHFIPPPRSFGSGGRGFRGYLDKRQDVPNLMDADLDDSDSMASSKATSVASERPTRPSPATNRLAAHVARTKPFVPARDLDDESDVFDDISKFGIPSISSTDVKNSNGLRSVQEDQKLQFVGKAPKQDDELNVITLRGGLRVIQTTQQDFEMRTRPNEFDENLSNSEVDQYGFVKTPAFREMMTAGRRQADSANYAPIRKNVRGDDVPQRRPTHLTFAHKRTMTGLDPPANKLTVSSEITSGEELSNSPRRRHLPPMSRGGVFDTALSDTGSGVGFSDYHDPHSVALVSYHGDLSKYRVRPGASKQLVRAFRQMSRVANTGRMSRDEFQKFEDAKKGFALSEMRSRVMEKDLERGLERQGGTVPVDDIALTPYYQASHRVRDAVIVSKAWRDGASPSDVVTAINMTRRAERTHFVKRRMYQSLNRSHLSDSMSVASDYSRTGSQGASFMEEVAWMDDTDFMQMRCPSLGPRTMRGFEMFTIGDCQSILLKLTNERCIQLRSELNEATARQIDAEDMMKGEEDYAGEMMTESEMVYLAAMEDVKTISKRLVIAEKSFNLVRDRIEKLVARYEAILCKMENESIATASVITYESSCYSNEYDSEGSYAEEDEEDLRERETFQRRARRAELRAELAARVAILAKQEVRKVREEKQREIDVLQLKLAELLSESSYAIPEREHSIVVANTIARRHGAESHGSRNGQSTANVATDRVNDVKQKFRDRMAERLQSRSGTNPGNYPPSIPLSNQPAANRPALRPAQRSPTARSQRRMLVGEEMYQHLDFYERSLRAVDSLL